MNRLFDKAYRLPQHFTPLSISGLVLWLDASYITGLNDGDSINTELRDLSGNGYHATQSTAAQRPIYKVNIINSRPVVRFDAVDDNLVITNGGLLLRNKPGATAFGVVLVNASGTKRWLTINTPTTTTRMITNRSDFGYRILDADAGVAVTGPALSNSTFYVVSCVFDALNATGQSFRNGTAGTLVNGGTAGNTSDTTGSSSDIGWTSTLTIDGDLATVILYDRALSTTERQRVERYLGSRYGITVS